MQFLLKIDSDSIPSHFEGFSELFNGDIKIFDYKSSFSNDFSIIKNDDSEDDQVDKKSIHYIFYNNKFLNKSLKVNVLMKLNVNNFYDKEDIPEFIDKFVKLIHIFYQLNDKNDYIFCELPIDKIRNRVIDNLIDDIIHIKFRMFHSFDEEKYECYKNIYLPHFIESQFIDIFNSEINNKKNISIPENNARTYGAFDKQLIYKRLFDINIKNYIINKFENNFVYSNIKVIKPSYSIKYENNIDINILLHKNYDIHTYHYNIMTNINID